MHGNTPNNNNNNNNNKGKILKKEKEKRKGVKPPHSALYPSFYKAFYISAMSFWGRSMS